MENKEYLIEVRDLVKEYSLKGNLGAARQKVMAVNHANIKIKSGEIYGLVGESGCGKSTLGRCILQLIEPTSGSICYNGKELLGLKRRELEPYKKKIQCIFQNPYASMNPKLKIRTTLLEVLKHFHMATGKEEEKIKEILQLVGIGEEALDKFPHQFSGGQLQRIAIARALLVEPEFIIADEPVSALDVSIQAQVLNLLVQLKKQMGLTILFISHDLSVVEYLCDRVAVIYNGVIVEDADVDELYHNTLHPYTRALLSAIPIPDPEVEEPELEMITDSNDAAGEEEECVYYSRCPERIKRCKMNVSLYEKEGHCCKCILPQSV